MLQPVQRGRVTTNVMVRDMDLVRPGWGPRLHRLEVVADGLTQWHGAQLAVDTTLVSLLCRDGSARGQLTTTVQRWSRTHLGRWQGEACGVGGRSGRAVEQRHCSVPVFPCQSSSAECAFGVPGQDGGGLVAAVERSLLHAAQQGRLLFPCWTVARRQGQVTMQPQHTKF